MASLLSSVRLSDVMTNVILDNSCPVFCLLSVEADVLCVRQRGNMEISLVFSPVTFGQLSGECCPNVAAQTGTN